MRAAASLIVCSDPHADLQLLWKGQEAFETALDLIASAEHCSRQHAKQTGTVAEQFVWRQDILRPAADARQVHHMPHVVHFIASCRQHALSRLNC